MKKLGIDITEECLSLPQIKTSKSPDMVSCGTNRFLHNKEANSDITSAAYITAHAESKDRLNQIALKFPSVGATENLLLCFAFTNSKIQINNAAREPEIVTLQQYLNQIGANIKGAGTSHITISPVGTDLNKKTQIFNTPSDRIETGTYLIAGGICGGEIFFRQQDLVSQKNLLKILAPSISSFTKDSHVTIKFKTLAKASNLIITSPYPGFPTDLQSPLSSYFTTLCGKNYIIESIFQNRTAHIEELKNMGAMIYTHNNCFVFDGRGQTLLSDKTVHSKDLRGGAALILAALSVHGYTKVIDNSYISRGYVCMEDKLSQLGADIKKERQS